MFYATVVDEKNLGMIAKKNGGVKPKVEPETTWFVWDTDPEGFNEILSSSDFHEKYRTPLDIIPHYNEWSEVKKK